jgi:ATP-dependent helicase STH1/SNF2
MRMDASAASSSEICQTNGFVRAEQSFYDVLTIVAQDYPDYYQLITQPIALSHLRKRGNSNYYKDVNAYRNDWKLMFRNARTYNQEGSWVYIDAEEMEKVFDATFERVTVGSGLPGAALAVGGSGSSASYESALTPMDDDDRPPPTRSRSAGRKQVISEDEYLTPSEDDG